MKLAGLPIIETKKIYLDQVEEWVDIPVWDQEELIKIVNLINWESLSLSEYKKALTSGWPGLSASAKARLKSSVAARDEFYTMIVRENWGLKPGAAQNQKRPFYSEVELENVRLWFASNKVQGRQPLILGEL